MNINSVMLIEEIRNTYKRFGKCYDFLLREYSSIISDVTENLYIEHPKMLKGVILLDGCNVNFTSTQLTQLFIQNGICCILVVCLDPSERAETIQSTGDANKCIEFENYSVIRYFSTLLNWLRNIKRDKRRNNGDKIIVCNFTQYRDLRYWFNMHKNEFCIVYDLEQLNKICGK